jgi:aminoglycoside 2''-phosphotransferase
MFEGLNSIPWVDLTHAYGSAEEVPMWLRQLASDDEQVRHEARRHLGGSICHQGWICHPTAYAVPYLIELLEEPTVQEKEEILDLLTWIAKADPIHERPRWAEDDDSAASFPSEPVPLRDAHAVAGAGIPVYSALLDAPELNVRMQAASLLMRFPERARELWPILQAAFEREETEQGRMNLAFALSAIGRRLPEQKAFFVEQFQTSQNKVIVFATALALAWLAKTETPEEVVQLLAQAMLEPSVAEAYVGVYAELPCGVPKGWFWNNAIIPLCLLGSERLQSLAPLLEERLASARTEERFYHMEHLAMLLLFIVFGEKTGADSRLLPEEALSQYQQQTMSLLLSFIILGKEWVTSQPARPAAALTERQRATLLVVLRQDKAWRSNGLGQVLRAYGLPDSREALAAYLGQELPPPVIRQAPRSQPAGPPRQDRIAMYKEAIQAAYPDLRIRQTQGRMPDEASQEDYRLMVNGEILFQFPTRAESLEKLAQEVALRRFLQDRLPLCILAPEYASLDSREVGRVFVGYVMPPGKLLYKEMLESIDGEETIWHLIDELALFLKTLHSIPIAELAHFSLPEAAEREALITLYARVRADLFPQMSPERQAQVSARFETFLENDDHFAVMPTLIHGSFGPQAVLYQAKTRSISAIVGFSYARLSDSAHDVAGLLGSRGYGETVVQRFEATYPEVAQLLERARFYAEARALEEELRRRAVGNQKVFSQTTYYPR